MRWRKKGEGKAFNVLRNNIFNTMTYMIQIESDYIIPIIIHEVLKKIETMTVTYLFLYLLFFLFKYLKVIRSNINQLSNDILLYVTRPNIESTIEIDVINQKWTNIGEK